MGEAQTPISILLIEDDENLRSTIHTLLETNNYTITSVPSARIAISSHIDTEYDLVLTDFRMDEIDGLELISRWRARYPESAIVLMTAYGDTDLALEAIRRGAYDYLSKPFTANELLLTLRKVEERRRLKLENAELRSTLERRYSFGELVATSTAMKECFDTIKRLSHYSTTVLVTGESGTGKELVARALHNNSPRRGKPFIPINCGAIPEHLIESELFGHAKGAFTDAIREKPGLFEEAHEGTVFLDEIGEIPLHLQAKLLRVLQERTVRPVGSERTLAIDVRVVAATNRDLYEEVAEGRFREDLFFRLNVVSLYIPPLRERREDIPPLIEHFIRKVSSRISIPPKTVSPEAQRRLLDYRWKGNIRELENAIERAMVLSQGSVIEESVLPREMLGDSPTSPSASEDREELKRIEATDDLSIKTHSRDLEIMLIKRALERTNGNRTHAAKLLELSHRALLYKIKEYRLT